MFALHCIRPNKSCLENAANMVFWFTAPCEDSAFLPSRVSPASVHIQKVLMYCWLRLPFFKHVSYSSGTKMWSRKAATLAQSAQA